MSIDVFPATVLNSTLWDGQTYEEGTFTVTGTGFSGVAPSSTAWYVRVGKQVTIVISTGQSMSNATTMTLTGLPSALAPQHDIATAFRGADNGLYLLSASLLQVNTGTTTILLYQNWQGSGWTETGIKGWGPITLSYLLA